MAQLLSVLTERYGQASKTGHGEMVRRIAVPVGLAVAGGMLLAARSLRFLPPAIGYCGVTALILAFPLFWLMASGKKVQHQAVWWAEQLEWFRLVYQLQMLPDDWVILTHRDFPMAVGPGGVWVIVSPFHGPDRGSGSSLQTAVNELKTYINQAGFSFPPGEITVSTPSGLTDSPLEPTRRMVTVEQLNTCLQSVTPFLTHADINRLVWALSGTQSTKPQPRLPATRPSRAKNRSPVRMGRFLKVAAWLAAIPLVILAVTFGFRYLAPVTYARVSLMATTTMARSPKLVAILGLPLTEEYGNNRVSATVTERTPVYAKIGGGPVFGYLKPSEVITVIDQYFESKQEPWLFIKNSEVEGWVNQAALKFAYLPAGTIHFAEPDVRIGTPATIKADTPAVLRRRRFFPNKPGGVWWELSLPGSKPRWVLSDKNPLIH